MIKKETYTIPGAKGRNMLMDLTFNDANPKAPLVIFAHGFKGFKDWGTHNMVANYFATHGFRYLKFNFSHNGTTPDQPVDFVDLIAFGDNTFSIELDDLKAVIDFACNGTAIPAANEVFLIGHSMGGGISIIKAAEDGRIARLVTFASISVFYNLWAKNAEAQWKLQGVMYVNNARTNQQMPLHVGILNDLEQHPGRLDIIKQAAKVTQPWLIFHGDKDTSVPLKHAQDLHTAQPNAKLIIMKGGDHVFGASHPYTEDTLPKPLLEFCEMSVAFFSEP
ncbi:alpha/beta hydrolase family protein [Mucilaginibacter gracilis]|uniref:Alpha/beta hydrolase family protein n=1 Tax=Mucilaginibacter gracilis TaxID=423350 RepID=A0A495J8N4_9SPHI|nr:alpha/beta hydrolase [Mucilaginibacter gracilis]RKR85041.1 alpha/beta hydrolase family protein [Mucilaginibacter gracilis]